MNKWLVWDCTDDFSEVISEPVLRNAPNPTKAALEYAEMWGWEYFEHHEDNEGYIIYVLTEDDTEYILQLPEEQREKEAKEIAFKYRGVLEMNVEFVENEE